MKMERRFTGYSRNLRKRLKAAREEKGLTADQVGQMIGIEMGRRGYSGQAVLYWESFERHPPIDTYAAWARVLGWRLFVDVVPASESGTTLTLRTPDAAAAARLLDSLTPEARRAALAVIEQMARR